jgi:Tfp pilus assembly PilM family ATPase
MKSIGIDPGDQMVKVVALDGSYKKTRLLQVHTAEVAGSDLAQRSEAMAAAVRAAVEAGMRGDSALGHPCREAVLRTIELPFQGHDAIRKVVKSEIEGEIQSQSVDDMVVDFHEIGPGSAGGTRILVASVPKPGLRQALDALAGHKVEPDRVDLDTMALYRVADWAGAFAPDEDAVGAAKPITAVLDLGARSVKVLLVEGEQLVEMRALRLGDAAIVDELARKHGVDSAAVREAVQQALHTRQDQRVDVTPALPVPVGDGAEPAAATPLPTIKVVVKHTEAAAAATAWLQRLSRELTRFLTAAGRAGAPTRVFVTGGASRLPGAMATLEEVFGVAPRELDVLGNLQHDLPAAEAEALAPRLAVAVGLALGRLGGPEGFELRQEDLVLTRGFERIKFPLAIACMLGLLAMFIALNGRIIERRNLEWRIGRQFVTDGKVSHCGMLAAVLQGDWFREKKRFQIGKDYTFEDLEKDLATTGPERRIQLVRDKLRAVANQKQKESGVYEDVSIESGLAVLVRWAEMMKGSESQLGRFLVTKIDLSMKGPNRRLEFTVAFRGDDFRSRRDTLQAAIEAELKRPDTPFEVRKGEAAANETPFKDPKDAQSGIPGAYYKVVMQIKDVFPPFGPSSRAVGALSTLSGERPAVASATPATEGK